MDNLQEYRDWLDELHKVDENSSIEEINKALEEAEVIRFNMYSREQGTKVFINSCYGATAAPYFIGYNVALSEAITLQGQDVIHFASQAMEDYFQKLWPVDKKMHKLLGVKTPGKVEDKVTVYGDTDTLSKSMEIKTNIKKSSIEDIFETCIDDAESILMFKNGNEILKPNNLTVENYENDEVRQSKVRYLIRHKISKPMYRVKTKSGKYIDVSSDHSCIVFRDGKKIEVKPEEILKTDKILVTI